MEDHKVSKLLNDLIVLKFAKRKWIEVKDLSNGHYSVDKNIRFKTPMLSSDFCDYSNACVVVKGTIDLLAAAANEYIKARKGFAFKNNVSFRLCISEIVNTLIDNAEDRDIVMPMYNLYSDSDIQYSDNYSMMLESL